MNYDHAIAQMVEAGLVIDQPVVPNHRVQRWRIADGDREKRGWSRLREWTSRGGHTYVVGYFGVWRGADDGFTKLAMPPKGDIATPALDEEDRRALRAAQAAERKAVAEQRQREAKQAAQWAATVWTHATPATEHEYLTRKGVGAHGARVLIDVEKVNVPGLDERNAWRLRQAAGALLVPMHDTVGQVCGLQFIYPAGHERKKKTGRDKEFWPFGMAMGGTFGLIGPLPRSGVVLVTEGFATAASLAEATGYSVVYAFSANNLEKTCKALRAKLPAVRLLICADDDYLTDGNPGKTWAARTSAAVDRCAWVAPDFTDENGHDCRDGRKLTDFNDLAQLLGVPAALANPIHRTLDELGWRDGLADGSRLGGGVDGAMPSLLSVEDAVARFWGTYGLGGKVLFDEVERRLVHRDDVMNLVPPRSWDLIKGHPGWRVARDTEIGFDPTEQDPAVRCNLFGGWPTEPKPGECSELLGLLEYLCAGDGQQKDLFEWVLRWLAYPLQHRGAKMHTALIVHGPQGTGKSRFFEAYAQIFGPYARVLGQEALEDKFNADWAEKKLFILADEVLARGDMYHVKNRLKGFVTGDTIRVNPKNVAAHTEKNQMNIVFLSNERMPAVLEQDDRRHCVIWVPPKLTADYYQKVNDEIANGGVAALHHYLLHLDLGDFRPWTPPPVTRAKADLVQLGRSSEERFLADWQARELESPDGEPIPFCPCLGSSLYLVYTRWCEQHGERRRAAKDLIGLCGKQAGWVAGETRKTHETLRAGDVSSGRYKSRKLVIPSDLALQQAHAQADDDARQVLPRDDETRTHWLTRCFFAFERAIGKDL